MRFFRRRADVGKYEDPPVRPLAPFETVVDDGVMISLAAVRLAAKNRIILSAVRDRKNFDAAGVTSFIRTVLARLADENEETADRVDLASQNPGLAQGVPLDVAVNIRDSHMRRPDVHRALAVRLHDLAADTAAVAELVAQAQDAAADELTDAVATRAAAPGFDAEDDYVAERPERLRGLQADLAELRSEND
jgi:hypothetical protein